MKIIDLTEQEYKDTEALAAILDGFGHYGFALVKLEEEGGARFRAMATCPCPDCQMIELKRRPGAEASIPQAVHGMLKDHVALRHLLRGDMPTTRVN
jgi:hypothetical protein